MNMRDGIYAMVETHHDEQELSYVVVDGGTAYNLGPISQLSARNNGASLTPLFMVEKKEAFAINALITAIENICTQIVDLPDGRSMANDFLREAKIARGFLNKLEEYK